MERTGATNHVSYAPVVTVENEWVQTEIIRDTGIGHAPMPVEDPCRKACLSKVDVPPLPRRHVDERQPRCAGPDKTVEGADGSRVIQRIDISGKDQMVSVVDLHLQLRIEVGSASAAGLHRCFVDMHRVVVLREAESGCEPRQAGSDYMCDSRHRYNAFWSPHGVRATAPLR